MVTQHLHISGVTGWGLQLGQQLDGYTDYGHQHI